MKRMKISTRADITSNLLRRSQMNLRSELPNKEGIVQILSTVDSQAESTQEPSANFAGKEKRTSRQKETGSLLGHNGVRKSTVETPKKHQRLSRDSTARWTGGATEDGVSPTGRKQSLSGWILPSQKSLAKYILKRTSSGGKRK